MTFMNKDIALHIASEITARKYVKLIEAKNAECFVLADLVLEKLVDQKLIMSLPDVYWVKAKNFNFTDCNGQWGNLSFSEPKRIPASFSWNKAYINYQDENLTAYRILREEIRSLNLDWDSEKKSLVEMLRKFSTIRKLIEAWPEVESFIPDWALKAKSTAVAIPIASLNARFGLPPEMAGAA